MRIQQNLLSGLALSLALCLPLALAPQFAQAQSKAPAASEGITIVIPVNSVAGKGREEVKQAMAAMNEVIRKQPGLIDEQLLENKNPANKPNYVHVMRWRALKDWEAVFAKPEFQKAIAIHTSTITVDGAGLYTPVK